MVKRYSMVIKEATRDLLLKARSIMQGKDKRKIVTNEFVVYMALSEYIKKNGKGE